MKRLSSAVAAGALGVGLVVATSVSGGAATASKHLNSPTRDAGSVSVQAGKRFSAPTMSPDGSSWSKGKRF